ncbi:MAG: site-2 protease family protein [Phycisphaerales bacterium]|nr:site-2 protease family protein [Phycisphaerales bacterium]
MPELTPLPLAAGALDAILSALAGTWIIAQIVIGFTLIIFVHELGHFLAAKWVGVRVDRFAIGFGPRLFGWRRGEGLTLGRAREYTADELAQRRFGETDYCFKLLPLGGYVKMLGQEDFIVDEKTGELTMGTDPRAFTNRPVGARMIVASAGVIFNFLFAIFLLMLVFMVGLQLPAPKIGAVEPARPAARAGLLGGDRVVEIDGRRPDSFGELHVATVLAEGDLRIRVERAGKLLDFTVTPEIDPRFGEPSLGVMAAMGTRIARESPAMFGPVLQAGDVIRAVDGRPVSEGHQVLDAVTSAAGRLVTLTVDRTTEGRTETIEIQHRAVPALVQRDLSGEPTAPVDRCDLLGLIPRTLLAAVVEGSPAAAAGLLPGDVVTEWGTISNPKESDIRRSLAADAGTTLRVVVQRGDERFESKITPNSPTNLLGGQRTQIGVGFAHEWQRCIIADVRNGSPAAALNLPRGAEILSIDARPTPTWFELIDALRTAAGRTVTVRFRSGSDEAQAPLSVPASVLDAAKLPPDVQILAINGKQAAAVKGVARLMPLPLPAAVRALLEENIGKTVELRYARPGDDKPSTVSIEVTAQNADPWQLDVRFEYGLPLDVLLETVSAGGNPILALQKGIGYTTYVLRQIFSTMKRVSTAKEAPTKNLSGPIGIVQIAYAMSKTGLAQLLFFLAFLSANLAVINFLPLPVLDGGLMMFLILEKIRGKPLTLKSQAITTMIGLAVIGVVTVFVLVQDISRLL